MQLQRIELLPTEVSPTRMYLNRQLNYRLSYICQLIIISIIILSDSPDLLGDLIIIIIIAMLTRFLSRLAFSFVQGIPPQKVGKNINKIQQIGKSTFHTNTDKMPEQSVQHPRKQRTHGSTSKLQNKPSFRIQLKRISDPGYFMEIINNDHPIKETNRLLYAIANGGSGLSRQNFETVFKKYCYYVQKLPQKESYAKASLQEKIEFLDALTQIYTRMGNLITQHMLKTFNKTCDEIMPILIRNLSQPTQLSIQNISSALLSISRYNNKKCYALFKSLQTRLHSSRCLLQLNQISCIRMLEMLGNLKITDRLIIETCIDTLRPEVSRMALDDFQVLLYSLAHSGVPMTRNFVVQLADRLKKELYKKIDPNIGVAYGKSKQSLRSEIKFVEYMSLIEKNMRLASAYLPELNGLFQIELIEFVKYAHKMDDRQLDMLCRLMRRCCYYDQLLLSAIASEILRRPVKELQVLDLSSSTETTNNKNNIQQPQAISINTMSSALHSFATFHYRNQPLITYFIKTIELVSQKNQLQLQHSSKVPEPNSSILKQKQIDMNRKHIMNPKHYSRAIWALCVTANVQELAKAYPIIWPYFNTQYTSTQPPLHESLNFYYSYLLLKTYFPSDSLNLQEIVTQLAPEQLVSEISETHEKIYNAFISSGVAALKEYNISNLMCDIFIPRYVSSNRLSIAENAQETSTSIEEHAGTVARTEKEGTYVINNVAIDVHGQHHFMRNCDRVKGGTWLKGKILQKEGYVYQYIGVQEWGLIHDKQQFVTDFMDRIARAYGTKMDGSEDQGVARKRGRSIVERGKKGEKDKQEGMTSIVSPVKKGRRIKTNSSKLQAELSDKSKS